MSRGVERAKEVPLDRENYTAHVLEEEPSRLTEDDFRCLLMSCVLSGASDVTFQSDQAPRAEIHGVLYRAMRKPLAPSDVEMILMETYGGANARAEINGQNVLDYSYELNLPDGGRQRFRVNATGIFGQDGQSVEITMRALPSKTPDLSMVQIAESEIEALTPKDGIVIIAGATGSGKSTTMAAITRYHLESSIRPVKIVDIQAPIEYTFRDVTSQLKGSPSIIGQSEVNRHIRSFADGVHSALRRKPNIINVGEARDLETISASVEASLTGHLVYTTTHAGSVSSSVRRLLAAFPGAEKEARAYDLISSLRFLMVQHLVPRIDRPGRVPVREYLRFTDRVREKLLTHPISDWSSLIDREVSDGAVDAGEDDLRMCLHDETVRLRRAGVISKEDALRISRIKEAEE
jgi:defect-in-organelle-trafficking protein DotB